MLAEILNWYCDAVLTGHSVCQLMELPCTAQLGTAAQFWMYDVAAVVLVINAAYFNFTCSVLSVHRKLFFL